MRTDIYKAKLNATGTKRNNLCQHLTGKLENNNKIRATLNYTADKNSFSPSDTE